MRNFRAFLYSLAKFLGDVNAVSQATKKNSLRPIVRRVERRIVGRLVGRAMRRLI